MPVDLVAGMLDGHRNRNVGVTAEEGLSEGLIVSFEKVLYSLLLLYYYYCYYYYTTYSYYLNR